MSITLITGTPGAGKTLYTVGNLLQPLIGQTIEIKGPDGQLQTVPRVIYSNINGLLLDHEKIDGGTSQGLCDWHEWAKPGSVIVFDEVQEFWKPRPNGSAVPAWIQKLETHRHMGVDFILVTQNVMLVDRNVHALADRHLHVRRIANMKLATVYEWDHVSRTLNYSKSLTKSPWRYSSKVFELYKSAEVHTKQRRKLPGLIWYILAGVLALAFLGPTLYKRLQGRVGTPQADQVKSVAPLHSPLVNQGPTTTKFTGNGIRAPINDMTDWKPRIVDRPETAPAYDQLRVAVVFPKLKGFMCVDNSCRCFTQQGTVAEISPEACTAYVQHRPFDPYESEQLHQDHALLSAPANPPQ